MKWSHTIYVEVPDGPEDWKDVECRLHVEGSKGRPAAFNVSWGNWEPPEDGDIELLGFKIRDGDKWRHPVPACYPDTFDQHIIDEVDGWFSDRSAECWESLEEYAE